MAKPASFWLGGAKPGDYFDASGALIVSPDELGAKAVEVAEQLGLQQVKLGRVPVVPSAGTKTGPTSETSWANFLQ